MKIKSGDRVKIIAGKDKGKKGKILQVFAIKKKASVEGINLAIKHMRPRKQNEKGQKIEFPAPISISNILLICPKCNKSTRVAYKYIDKPDSKKEKVRMCRNCHELID
jgi:large subunit ribosomal protein L24